MSGRKGQIHKGLSQRRKNAPRCKGALCQKAKVICQSARASSLSSSPIGLPTGQYTSAKSFLHGWLWKLHGVITTQKCTTIKKEKKNFAFIRPLAWLLKGQNKMTDKEELIKALCIAIGCLKSKTFDEGVIGDLEAVLKKATAEKESNEKIQN